MGGRFGGRDDFEQRLRRAYGEPSRSVVDRLARSVPARGGSLRRSALVFAASFSVVAVATLASFGGVGYAASTVGQVARQVAHPAGVLGKQVVQAIDSKSAGSNEYGQSSSATSSQIPPDSTTTQTYTAGSATVSVPPATSNAIVAAAGGQAVINIDPDPPTAGTAFAAVGIVVTDSGGNVIHPTLAGTDAPLDVALQSRATGLLPCIDRGDGNGCVATPYVGRGPIPAGYGTDVTSCSQLPHGDGFYFAPPSNGPTPVTHILTCHLTIFALVSKADLKVSVSGRPLQAANSGKFGDAALYSTQAARAKVNGASAANGRLTVGFFVDQQVAAYVTVFEGPQWKGVTVPIAVAGSKIGGTQVKSTASAVRTLHVPILRPGTHRLTLQVPGLQAGTKYRVRLTVLNYDGTKTVTYGAFTP